MWLLKKIYRLPVPLMFLLILLPLPCTYGQEEILVLDHPDAFFEKQRPAVNFPHEIHMGEFDCLDCHHDYNEAGENILDAGVLEEGNEEILCSSCHDATTVVDIQSAFHQQCMGCHRGFRTAGEATGPELCGECHIK